MRGQCNRDDDEPRDVHRQRRRHRRRLVRLNVNQALNPVQLIGGVLGGLLSTVVGVAGLLDAGSPFSAVSWSMFLVAGYCALGSWILLLAKPYWSRRWPSVRQETLSGEPADYYPRRTGLVTLFAFSMIGSIGGWFALMGIVGQLEENWLWPVLTVVPAVYFLGFVGLRAVGRFRAAGVWVTPTRVVNEHYGLRTELALTQIMELRPRSEELILIPRETRAVRHDRLTPKPWRARLHPTRMVIRTADLDGGSEVLAGDIRRRLDRGTRDA